MSPLITANAGLMCAAAGPRLRTDEEVSHVDVVLRIVCPETGQQVADSQTHSDRQQHLFLRKGGSSGYDVTGPCAGLCQEAGSQTTQLTTGWQVPYASEAVQVFW